MKKLAFFALFFFLKKVSFEKFVPRLSFRPFLPQFYVPTKQLSQGDLKRENYGKTFLLFPKCTVKLGIWN